MKKLISLLVISMFALAACVPTDSSVTGNSAPMDTEVITMETEIPEIEDSKSGDSEMDESETPEAMETESVEMEASGSMDIQSARVVEVTIRNGAFDPQEITIHETTTINWINADSVEHTLVITKMDDSSDAMDDSSDDKDDSSTTSEITLNPGETASFVFDDDGVYEFSLSGNATLSGTIMVSDDYDHDAYDDLYDDDDMDDDSSDSYDDDAYDDSDDNDSYDDDSYDDDSYDDDSYDDDSYDDDGYDDDSSDDSDDDYEEDEEDEEDESDDYESSLFSIAA